ncbi:MAG: bifunctional 4-hydroxy-3-methylbut-2-enyl diphosphate reductase/30S ribosomal protein S1 [Solirubrobacterales bacterium]
MNIYLAEQAGFCFGVKRAVQEALKVKDEHNKRVYTLGPLIHNNDVVDFLKKKDIYPIEPSEIDSLKPGDVIIIRSHGVPLAVKESLEEAQLVVLDATCPFVSNIQHIVKKHYQAGYKIVIVGDSSHPEVIGINGWCDNSAVITKNGSELNDFNYKICVVSQTTEKQENWERVLSIIVKNSREFVGFNTICKATSERQKCALELSKKVDMMVVIGGKNSSNTTKLYEICSENCKNTIHVENSDEIPMELIKSNVNSIGVTAGASTPDWIIKEAILKMDFEKNIENNEQLEFMEKNDTKIAVGQVIKGEIISVNEKEAFLNIGYKADGILPKNEVTKDDNENLTDLLKAGEEVEVKVVKRRSDDGYVVLSKIELQREKAYDELKGSKDDNATIKVIVKEASNAGLVGSYKGVRVFIPASHVELFHTSNLNDYVGKELEVSIIEFSEQNNKTRIVASRRDILKAEKSKAEEAAWSTLEKDTTVQGEVKRITDFGAFVNVNGLDGLLHVSEISWGRVNKPADVLKVGDVLNVYILDIDREKKKLSLSLKKLIENPWNNIDEKYPVGSVVMGKVVRFANFGAFVELEPGVDGLVHISQISNKRINKPENALTIGEVVKAKIIDVDTDLKKIGLSIREVDEV